MIKIVFIIAFITVSCSDITYKPDLGLYVAPTLKSDAVGVWANVYCLEFVARCYPGEISYDACWSQLYSEYCDQDKDDCDDLYPDNLRADLYKCSLEEKTDTCDKINAHCINALGLPDYTGDFQHFPL